MAERMNMAVLLSGGGTTLQNFVDLIEAGKLDARVAVVVSSRADAFGLERAKQHGIPTAVVASRKFRDFEAMSDAIDIELQRHAVELVTMAGFMCFLRIPSWLEGRVMNIHPALIPAFCGKGWYGHRVHEAVIEFGAKLSGCTVHFADNEYDHGPIIIQRAVPVLDEDTPDTLAARVGVEERKAYPEAVQLFAEGRLRIEHGRVRVLRPGE